MGTKSILETTAPQTTREWTKELGQLYADVANRRREEKEARTLCKVAESANDFVHAEIRHAAVMTAAGKKIGGIGPVPTA